MVNPIFNRRSRAGGNLVFLLASIDITDPRLRADEVLESFHKIKKAH